MNDFKRAYDLLGDLLEQLKISAFKDLSNDEEEFYAIILQEQCENYIQEIKKIKEK